MKGNINIDITKKDYVYIDGATGQELTQEEFNRRHNKGIRSILGASRAPLQTEKGQGENGTT